MKQFWNAITNIGVDETANPFEVRFINLVNTLAIFVSLFELSYLSILILYLPRAKFLLYFLTAIAVLNLGTLLLNYFKFYLFARIYFGLLGLIVITIISVFVGREILMYLFLVESIVIVFFIYPVREKRFMYTMTFLFASAFIGLEIWFSQHSALLEAPTEFFIIIKYGIVAGLLILMFAISFYSYMIINRSEARLEDERQKSENLLLNILPKPIANRLKAGSASIADRFDEATILFSDIVDFTDLVKTMPANDLVAMLNEIFSEFDRLADRYSLEKIKTIGDAYMVAGGIPKPMTDHCEAIADMAINMQQFMQNEFNEKFQGIQLRIGIHTGPVVAGVIGKRKFTYDLWGDSVNTASRMESHGVEGKIQVTQEVYEKLKERYQFEYRGKIEVKGKGKMDTYFLISRKEP